MDINDLQDEYVQLASTVVQALAVVSTPGKYMVEFFPILQYIPSWIPGAHFQRYAEDLRTSILKMRNVAFDNVKKNMVRTIVYSNHSAINRLDCRSREKQGLL